jgi:hypothetical protein
MSSAKTTFWFDSAWYWRDRGVVAAGRRAPVDVADLVAALVGAQALELRVPAAHAKRAEPRVLSPLPAEHLERARRVHVGVDVDCGRELRPLLPRDEAERRV